MSLSSKFQRSADQSKARIEWTWVRTQLAVRRQRPGLEQGACFEQRGGHLVLSLGNSFPIAVVLGTVRRAARGDAPTKRGQPLVSWLILWHGRLRLAHRKNRACFEAATAWCSWWTQSSCLSRGPGAGCARHGLTLMRAKEMSCETLFHSSNMSWAKSGQRFSTVWRANSDTTQS